MKVQKIVTEQYGTNSYIIDNKYVVDPGIGIGKHIKNKVDVILTHAHFDHLLGLNELNYDKIYLHPGDFEMIKNAEINLSKIIGTPIEIRENLYDIQDAFETIHTPGHTEGSVLIFMNNHIFSGDTVFYNSVGRTDLPSGDQYKLENSIEKIKKIFKTKDKNIIIHPGHMEETNIERILEENPYLF
ncbi:MBL fold metallo-hydrolase [Geotoga petraea]|jgi:glyoxylase-like metal-dependent hydrolase (beta-lactamase superfamily II)|uniref:MBL fold metallo-hydrolase n=1 Tax=Geotoga petraea TaxID=28234 RepID=A0A4Z0VVT0_9BACT|nr:MBL fold metallo-hydrolase [Geotoga petraea]TGG88204.1 MBL fold metallo-hydrolase [Geotoga petraea]